MKSATTTVQTAFRVAFTAATVMATMTPAVSQAKDGGIEYCQPPYSSIGGYQAGGVGDCLCFGYCNNAQLQPAYLGNTPLLNYPNCDIACQGVN